MNDFIMKLDNGKRLCRSCYRVGKTEETIKHAFGCYYAAWQAHRNSPLPTGVSTPN